MNRFCSSILILMTSIQINSANAATPGELAKSMAPEGIPLAITAALRIGSAHLRESSVNGGSPVEDYQVKEMNGRIYFHNGESDEGYPLKDKYLVSYHGHRETGKPREIGLFDRENVKRSFKAMRFELGERVMLDVGNGLRAAATFREIIADTSTPGGKLFASFEIVGLEELPSDNPRVEPIFFEVPFEQVHDRIFPLTDKFFELPKSPADQSFFLEDSHGLPVQVLVLAFRGDDMSMNDARAEVVMRDELETGVDTMTSFTIPALLLRKAMRLNGKVDLTTIYGEHGRPNVLLPAYLSGLGTDHPGLASPLSFEEHYELLKSLVWREGFSHLGVPEARSCVRQIGPITSQKKK